MGLNQNFNNNRIRQLGFYCLMLVLLLASVYTMLNTGSTEGKLEYSEVLSLFREEKVESFSLDMDSGELVMKLREKDADGQDLYAVEIANFSAFYNDLNGEIQRQLEEGILTRYDYIPAEEPSIWLSFLPYAFMLLIFGGFWFSMMKRAQGGDMGGVARFSKARTRLGSEEKTRKTFADVAGADEEKEELMEVVDFLRNPQAYTDMGAHIPRGVLLVGPPGTGKTLLAKAVAGEANVEFLTISGSDFVELYVGVGASRVRDLFDQAKKVAPAIVFIDEIDAVGRQRGSGLGGGHDEREQTLNQLLVEMDGFNDNDGVIVMAATNRADILDNALLRPGRFDRQIYVGAPDVKGREEILKVHARDKKLDASVNLRTVARSTAGFTGADLSNLLNEAAIMAARDNRPVLTMEDLNEAMMKITAGPAKKSHVQTRKDLKETAIHEAGHAVAIYHLPTHDPVRHISIIPRGQSLGSTWYLPKDDSSNLTRNEMYEQIVSLLGGRVAEALFIGDISVGASNDIDRATKLARDMVARYGMCEKLGTVSYLDGGEVFIGRDYQTTKSYSEKVAGTIDDEVKALIDRAYDQCRQILSDNRDKLYRVVDFLLEKESMTGEQFEAVMQGREAEEASATDLFDGFEETPEQQETT